MAGGRDICKINQKITDVQQRQAWQQAAATAFRPAAVTGTAAAAAAAVHASLHPAHAWMSSKHMC
jgi:acetoacetate decarboxylase